MPYGDCINCGGIGCSQCDGTGNDQSRQIRDRQLNNECFAASTLVMTPNGWQRIDSLSRLDLVVCFNEKTSSVDHSAIRKVTKHKPRRVVELVFGNNISLRVSGAHPILTKHGWRRAKEINDGTECVSILGETLNVLYSTEDFSETETLHNIYVRTHSNFLVKPGLIASSFVNFRAIRSFTEYFLRSNFDTPRLTAINLK